MRTTTGFRRHAVGLGAFLIACAVVFAVMWRFAGGDVNPLDDPYRVQAVVPTAVSLATHADVRHAGVRIGEVTKIADRAGSAILELALDGDHAPAYRNARVLVRAKTLSGENYVDLDPGTPAAGRVPDGGALSLANSGQAVQLDEILSTFDRERRRSLRRVLDGLGPGLRGRGAHLNRFLEGSAATIERSAPVQDVLAADRRQVAALIDDLGRVGRALGDRREAIAVLARRSRVLAQAVATRDDRLRATLAELPPFLRRARTASAALGAFSDQATPVVSDLAAASEQLVPAVRDLRPAAAATRRTMRGLQVFTRRATPLVSRLRPFARVATRFAGPLEKLMRETNPLLGYLAPRARDLGGILAAQRAGTEHYDALGHYGRVTPIIVTRSNVFGAFTPSQEAAYQHVVKSGVLQVTDTRGHNSYPDSADEPVDFRGSYPRLEREPAYSR